jgi:predicted nicotinamide N-methyase
LSQLETLIIENQSYTIQRLGDIDTLFEELLAKGENHADVKAEKIPYWADLWASSVAMSQFLLQNKDLLLGKNVIEIGAGLGLPSIVAAPFAQRVTVTDYVQEALDFSQKNFALNQVLTENVQFHLLDWRNLSGITQKYDVIIASDVAYERKAFDDLEKCLAILSHADSIILLSEPNRSQNRIQKTAVFEILLRGEVSKVNVYEIGV